MKYAKELFSFFLFLFFLEGRGEAARGPRVPGATGKEALRNQNGRIGYVAAGWLKTDDDEKGLKRGDNRDG